MSLVLSSQVCSTSLPRALHHNTEVQFVLEMSVARTVVLSKGKGFSFLFKAARERQQGEAAVLPIMERLNCSAE